MTPNGKERSFLMCFHFCILFLVGLYVLLWSVSHVLYQFPCQKYSEIHNRFLFLLHRFPFLLQWAHIVILRVQHAPGVVLLVCMRLQALGLQCNQQFKLYHMWTTNCNTHMCDLAFSPYAFSPYAFSPDMLFHWCLQQEHAYLACFATLVNCHPCYFLRHISLTCILNL